MTFSPGQLARAGLTSALLASAGAVALWCAPQTSAPQSSVRVPPQDASALAARANKAFEAGDYPEAIKDYRELIKSNPEVAEVHSNLAVAYYFSGQYADAAREAETALKLKPSLVNAHYFLGASLAQSGYCRQALPYLEDDFPHVSDPKLKRITGASALQCLMALDDVSKAIDYGKVLSREFPSDPEILYLTAHMYSDLATLASQRLLATAPGSYQMHRMNAEILALQGKPQEAITEYRRVLELNPHVPGIHYEIGAIMLQQSHEMNTLDKARKEFEEELQIDPGNAKAEYQLGVIAATVRDWNTAITHFKRAAQLDPQMATALASLGEAYASANRFQDAVAPLKRATELDPENADAHYRLSIVYRHLGLEREADQQLAAYKEAYEKLMQLKQNIRNAAQGGATKPQAAPGDR
ncbi:MAG TPA: tetratricopeptide repeat protein [Terriglobia bacterium]|nr:tetratricopeptide repeat protein [Terriglobia bacterium]